MRKNQFKRVGLEPKFGNFDHKFIDKWYSKLKSFSLILMKHIATYCEKTTESTNESRKNTEAILKILTENRIILNIDKILDINVEATKRQLQQQEFKKFSYLKYKLQPIKDEMLVTTIANIKKSCR